MDKVQILATSHEEAVAMLERARVRGVAVEGTLLWGGPVPPHSFVVVDDGVRMSTPEFFLFRKLVTSDTDEAFVYACEMFSHVGTELTVQSVGSGGYMAFDEPRTNIDIMYSYLEPVCGEFDDGAIWRCLCIMEHVLRSGMVEEYERTVVKTLTRR